MRKRSLALLLVALAAPLTAGLACLSCAGTPEDLGLADGHLRPCPGTPNCVNSEDPDDDARVAPLAYEGDGGAALLALVALVDEMPRTEVVTVGDGYAHVVFRTPLLRFRDDVELRLDEPAGVIHVRSASRVGRSDLGANRDRVEAIRARWTAR